VEKDLPAESADFYDAIVEKVAALRLNARQTIASVKKEQDELASQLQQNLARGESLRKADFQKLMGEVIEKRKAREKEVMEMLAQFQREEQALAQGLKELFGDGRQVRLRDFKRFIAEAKRSAEARKEDVEEITQASIAIRKSAEETIARFREEREEMAKSWKALAEKMQKSGRSSSLKKGKMEDDKNE
jgi:uncharacterized protein with ParB-like and HNH nuclease domain